MLIPGYKNSFKKDVKLLKKRKKDIKKLIEETNPHLIVPVIFLTGISMENGRRLYNL